MEVEECDRISALSFSYFLRLFTKTWDKLASQQTQEIFMSVPSSVNIDYLSRVFGIWTHGFTLFQQAHLITEPLFHFIKISMQVGLDKW